MVIVRPKKSDEEKKAEKRINSHAGIMVIVRKEAAEKTVKLMRINSHAGIMVIVRRRKVMKTIHAVKYQFPCGNYGHCKDVSLRQD